MIFKCYSCKSIEHSIVALKERIRFECYGHNKKVVKCRDCGLVQLYPGWTDKELVKLYSKYSQKKDFVGAKPKKTITPYLKKYLLEDDTILEVGCGNGDNVTNLRDKGYNIIGIDKDPTVCDGKSKINSDYKDFSGKFDFIYGIQVLEHLKDPKGFINWILNNLNEGGRFLLEFPNVEDPLLTVYTIPQFYNFYWYPYHLFFYSKKTAEQTFKEFNVEVKLIQRYGLLNHLHWLFFKKPSNISITIPIIDYIYKLILVKLFKVSDTLVLIGRK